MVVVTLALLLSTGQVPPSLSPEAHQAFKSWFERGEALYAEGEYGLAIAAFREADKLKATPEVAFDLAKCHEKLEDPAFSTFYYRQYLRRAPAAGDALEVAEILGKTLADAEQAGRGLLEVDGAEPGTVTVNGRSFPDFPVAVFLPPGDFEVSVQLPGGAIKRPASLEAGKVTSIQLDRVPPPLLALSNEPVSSTWGEGALGEVSTSARFDGRAALHTTSIVVLAASAAALAGGVAFGLMSNGDRARLSADRGSLTVSDGRVIARDAASKASTANLLLGIGAGGAVAGGLLFAFTLPEPGMAGAPQKAASR